MTHPHIVILFVFGHTISFVMCFLILLLAITQEVVDECIKFGDS